MGFCGGDNDEDPGEVPTTSQPCARCGDDGPHKVRLAHFVCPCGHVNDADMRMLSDVADEAQYGIYGESTERYPRGWHPDDEGGG